MMEDFNWGAFLGSHAWDYLRTDWIMVGDAVPPSSNGD